MSKDRPWNRGPVPEPEPPHAVPTLAGLEINDMDDAQVRAYCLTWARHHLVVHDLKGRLSDTDLEKAARFAQIAQAFRPGPE